MSEADLLSPAVNKLLDWADSDLKLHNFDMRMP